MELKDTVELMASADFKYRAKAEYWQVKIRYEKLKAMLNKYEVGLREGNIEGRLGFKPNCSFDLLREQQSVMGQYLHILELRAVIEDIDLTI